MNQGFDDAVRLIREGQNFLLTCHVLPDADAVGSMLGLAEVLKALGKNVVLYNRDPVPDMVMFLPGVEEIRQSIPVGMRFDVQTKLTRRQLILTHAPDLLPELLRLVGDVRVPVDRVR